jgi:hypothetical protein
MFEVQAGMTGSTVTEKYCQESPGLLLCLVLWAVLNVCCLKPDPVGPLLFARQCCEVPPWEIAQLCFFCVGLTPLCFSTQDVLAD